MRGCAKISVVAALLVAAGAACGEPEGVGEAQFCPEYARRECSRVAASCSMTATACEPVRANVCREVATRARRAGRRYSAARAQACLDQVLRTYEKFPVTAARLATLEQTCGRVHEGGGRAADPCAVDNDCEGDLVCDKGRCGTARVVAAGAGCANIGESCPRGEHCSDARGVYSCVKRQDRGMLCGPAQPCLERYRCVGTCTERLAVGMPCLADDDCETRYCIPHVLPETPRTCGVGLSFSHQSPSCIAFMTDI